MKMHHYFIIVFMCVLLFPAAYAQIIELPRSINLTFVESGHEKEYKIEINTTSPEAVSYRAWLIGPIKEWGYLYPQRGSVNNTDPAYIFLRTFPPENTTAGIYEGMIIIDIISFGNAVTSSTTINYIIDIAVGVTDESSPAGPLRVIKPVGLSLNPFVLILWIVVFAYVSWVVVKHHKSRK